MRAGLLVAMVTTIACVSKPGRPVELDTVDAPVVDAVVDAVDLCDPSSCGGVGGQCQNGACAIPSMAAVTCPDGMPCAVTCFGKDKCKEGVACGGATSCKVQCEGENACEKGVDCGTSATCSVSCIGLNACRNGRTSEHPAIECNTATCDVTCSGHDACEKGIHADAVCEARCCNMACEGGVGTCSVESVCI